MILPALLCTVAFSQTDIDLAWAKSVAAGFRGVAFVVTKDRVVFLKSSGSKGPQDFGPDTSIPICSVTKLMAADLVLGLVKDGKLSLSDAVGKYLPWISAHVKPVTIQQLLTHTSGILNMDKAVGFDSDGTAKIYRSFEPRLQDLKGRLLGILGDSLVASPGSKYDYNNGDFLVIQAIVEEVTGKPFGDLLDAKEFRPAGMKHSKMANWDVKSKSFILSYHLDKGVMVPYLGTNFGIYGASAGVISTAKDMSRWTQFMLRKPKDSSVLETGSQFGGFQGFGDYAYKKNLFGREEMVAERPGAVDYFKWQITFLPERGIAVGACTNLDGIKLGSAFEGSGPVVDLLRAVVRT